MADDSTDREPIEQPVGQDFAKLPQPPDPGLAAEFVEFLRYNKKWWLTPILVITLLLTLLAFLAASPVAPWIYSFF